MHINIIGSVNQLGYGLVTTNIVAELSKNHTVSLFPVNKNLNCHHKHKSPIEKAIENGKIGVNFDAPCIRIWHQFDMSLFCGGKKIGFPIFELDKFTQQEMNHLSSVDEIMVCSEWAKSVIEYNGLGQPVHVVPLGVDTDIFKPGLSEPHPYRFFAAGKWEYRKGHDIVLRAFNEAFTHEDNVELICLCDNPVIPAEDNKDWNMTFKSSKLGSKIHLIPRQESQEQVANVMQRVDCGIFPARAEGWNLELIEMMACNKPLITTNYSGHTEFCNTDNSILINYEEKEVAYDGHFFTQNIGSWMKFTDNNYQDLVTMMKLVYNDRLKENPEGLKTANEFSWNRSAEKIVEVLCK